MALDKWLTHGLKLSGGRDEKGFLFLYELMRGDLLFKIHTNDSGHALGCMLMRMLDAEDTQKKGFLMSVLRVLMHNPQLARHLPRFEDDRKVKFSVMFRGQEVLTKLIEKVTAVMREHEHAGKLCWPQHKLRVLLPIVRSINRAKAGVVPSGRLAERFALASKPSTTVAYATCRARAETSRSIAQAGDLAVRRSFGLLGGASRSNQPAGCRRDADATRSAT